MVPYSDEELRRLLVKPEVKKCTFGEYETWVVINFLLSTGVRQSSLLNIKIEDLHLEEKQVYIRHTKNHKYLQIPFNSSLQAILREYLVYRNGEAGDYLFCNAYGEKWSKGASYLRIVRYNHARGVETTGLHRFRHTFAKHFILQGGNPAILGHSSLEITQNYINLLVNDLAPQMEEIDIIKEFSQKQKIRLR